MSGTQTSSSEQKLILFAPHSYWKTLLKGMSNFCEVCCYNMQSWHEHRFHVLAWRTNIFHQNTQFSRYLGMRRMFQIGGRYARRTGDTVPIFLICEWLETESVDSSDIGHEESASFEATIHAWEDVSLITLLIHWFFLPRDPDSQQF